MSLLNEKVQTYYRRNRPVGSESRLHRHITHKDQDVSLPVFRFHQVHKSHWSYSPVLRKIYVTTTIHIVVTSSSIKNTDWQQAYKLFKNFTSFKFLSTHTYDDNASLNEFTVIHYILLQYHVGHVAQLV